MAKDIERLNAGQTPSLLQADKGNELIDGINNLRKSRSTANANASGFTLRVNAEGALELDVSSTTANAIEEVVQAQGTVGLGRTTVQLTTVIDGNFQTFNFVIA